jgi:hypothetical protein
VNTFYFLAKSVFQLADKIEKSFENLVLVKIIGLFIGNPNSLGNS